MANVPPRDLSISYNGQAVPGTFGGGRVTLTNVHTFRLARDEFEVVVDVLATGTPVSATCVAFEAAWGAELGDLEITLHGSELLYLRRSQGEALNTRTTIEKVGEGDSQGTRIYRVTIEGELPGQRAGARRDASFSVTMDASNRGEIEVSGEYTRSVGTGATANYRTNIGARFTTFLTALQAISSDFAGTWPLVEERFEADDNDDVCSFSRTYRQLIGNEASGTLDDSDVRDAILSVTVSSERGEGAPGVLVEPLVTVRADYEARIDRTQKSGIDALRSKWESAIKARVLEAMRSAIGGDSITEESQELRVNESENILSATVVALAVTGSSLVSWRQEIRTSEAPGVIVSKTWPRKNSAPKLMEPTPAYSFQGPKEITRTITTMTTTRGDTRISRSLLSQNPGSPAKAPGVGSQRSKRWVLRTYEPLERVYTKNGITLTDKTTVEIYELLGGVA